MLIIAEDSRSNGSKSAKSNPAAATGSGAKEAIGLQGEWTYELDQPLAKGKQEPPAAAEKAVQLLQFLACTPLGSTHQSSSDSNASNTERSDGRRTNNELQRHCRMLRFTHHCSHATSAK